MEYHVSRCSTMKMIEAEEGSRSEGSDCPIAHAKERQSREGAASGFFFPESTGSSMVPCVYETRDRQVSLMRLAPLASVTRPCGSRETNSVPCT